MPAWSSQQGRVLLDADVNELMAIVDRRLRALAQRHPGPRDGIVHHARRLQDQRRGRHAADRQGPPLCRRPAGREPWRGVRRSGQARVRRSAGREPVSPIRSAYDGAALPARSPCPADGRAPPGLSRCLGSRGHASRATRSGRERGRRRYELAHADGLAGARARRATPAPAPPARSPDADMPGWSAIDRALHRRAHDRHLRGRPGGRSLRAAADRRLSRPREPALPRRDPRSRPARRRRHLQMVARERQRRQPRRQHHLGSRA